MRNKSWLVFFIMLFILALAGCGENADKEIKSTEIEESKVKEENTEKEQIDISERKEGKILKKNDFEYTINKAKEWEILGFEHMIYASNDKAIISGCTALLVYDFNEKRITRALDVGVLDMNHNQGDITTNFIFNKEGSKVLMYNDDFSIKDKGEIKNIYLYEIDKDVLSEVDYTTVEDEYKPKNNYEQINSFDNEYTNKYTDKHMLDYRYIDDNNICFLLVPNESNGKRGITELMFLVVNTETKDEKVCTINF